MNRIELHSKLQDILSEYGGGSREDVYFQPPESMKISYPAIVYELNEMIQRSANNKNSYFSIPSYSITYITIDPDITLFNEMTNTFRHCRFSRSYASQNLNHYVYDVATC